MLRELERLRGKISELQELQAKYEATVQAFDGDIYKYRSLVEATPDPIVMYDMKGNFVSVNQKAAELVGLASPEDFVREVGNITDLLDQRDRQRAFANLERALKTGLSEGNEYLVHWKDGLTLPVEVNSSVVRGADGEPEGFISVVRDIRDRKRAEEALRGSEATLRSLLQAAPIGIGQVSADRVLAWTNEVLCNMLGYSKEELEGNSARMLYQSKGEYLRVARVMRPEAFSSGTGSVETCFKRKDGSAFDVMLRSAPIVPGDLSQGLVFTVTDITERKRAEEALRESEERFRTAFQTSPDPAAITRLSDGVFVEANEGFTELSGFTREEVIGKSSFEINLWHDPRDRDRLIAELNEKGYVTNLEAQFRQKDGEVRTGLMSAGILVLNGEPHILSVTRDVEDWKKAEQALRDSEEKYRSLFEESRDAVIMTTRDGVVEAANQAFLDLFGFTREEAQGMDIRKIYIDDASRRRFQRDIERDGSVKDYPVKRRKKDGAKIDCLVTGTVRRDKEGTILGYQGILRDVTDWNRLQRHLLQAQKMEAVGTLAGGIAHDFNNLLQAILGYTHLLLIGKEASDPDRQKLEIIHQAAQDGADLVSRILTFSMKAEFKARPTDLNLEIRRVEKLLLRTVPRMITIDLALADDLRVIDADPAQIEQVLLNLAVNAQHAMPDGGRLLIETSNVSLKYEYAHNLETKPGEYVLLTVSDTGTGMEPQVADRIFEPFFTTKADGAGTGLGLSIVHGIVSQHRGYIRCYSEPGLGTSFKIYFPMSESEGLPEIAVASETPAFGDETILLVDDDDRVRDLAQEMIKMWGYKALAASSGEEALKTYAAHRGQISLVILDLIMPGMGGKRCLEELLRIDPDAKVLLASGYSSTGFTFDDTGIGVRGFIRKPYDTTDMIAAIRKVLDQGHL